MSGGFGVGRMDWSPLQAIGQQLTINAELERQRQLEREATALFGQQLAGSIGTPGAPVAPALPSPVAPGFNGGTSATLPRADGTPINQPGRAAQALQRAGTGATAIPQGSGGAIQDKFVSALREGGLTNPYGLGAVAAYANHESRYSPKNITGSWADPSESGQAGTSGGILSWRDDRLANMRKFTAGASDPVVAQAQFTLRENPALTQALQNAKSPEEAHKLMADAWKFAGYNRPGGENAARLASTREYASRVGGTPTQVAAGGVTANDGPPAGAVPEQTPGLQPGALVSPPLINSPQSAGMAAPPAAARRQISPEQAALLQKMYANPNTRALAIKQAQELRAQPEYKFQVVGNQLVRTDERGGAEVVGIAKDPEFSQFEAKDGSVYTLNKQDGSIRSAIPAPQYRDVTNPMERLAVGAQGYEGPLQRDPQNRLIAPIKPDTSINIGDTADKEAAKKSAGALIDRFDAVGKEGETARNDVALVGELRALGTEIGTGGVAALQGKLAEYGIKTEGAGKIEAYNALVDRLTPQQRVPGAGATSDFDARMFKGSLPRLINTPEGNALIADTMEAVAKDKVARGAIADQALLGESRGGLSPQEAMKQLKALPSIQTGFVARLKQLGQEGKLSTTGGSGGQPKAMPEQVRSETRATLQELDRLGKPELKARVLEKVRQMGFDPSGL